MFIFTLTLVAGCSTPVGTTKRTDDVSLEPAALKAKGYFFVGGEYLNTSAGKVMSGQMYVEFRIPRSVTSPYAIVMIHGGGQTATNFLGTPDGRPGWADYFLARGYPVYIVDQPARGRSAYHADILGRDTVRSSAERTEQMFTATASHNRWPQSQLHSQWPGDTLSKGRIGDPVFDQFYASQVPWTGHVRSEEMIKVAGAALLNRIGPAILLTHSQSGPYGWAIADAKPGAVKAIVTVEPNGPPFKDIDFVGPPEFFKAMRNARDYGLTWTPIMFEPPITNASDLKVIQEAVPAWQGAIRCWLQDSRSVHKLPNLARVPVAVVTGEASFRAGVDHCTSRFLEQAGVANTHIRLENLGIHGNGHMMMLEKNNLEIARVIHEWIAKNVP